MSKGIISRFCCLAVSVVFSLLITQFFMVSPAWGAGATTSVHLIKYAADGVTVSDEKIVDYKWMEKNLKVYGDGKTHYYHQGPVFEGDLWDPDEVNNLKDKGAVKGTAIKDLCDLIGGMETGDGVMLVSVDKWHTEFAYSNVYEPLDIQGVIALCWYNGEDIAEGERFGVGYPANNAYRTGLQIVFMPESANSEGKYVFGNNDMKIALPQEKYQHFFEGQYPSTSGLSGKWVSELRIYSGGVPENLIIELNDQPPLTESEKTIPWIPIIAGAVGIVLVGGYIYLRRKPE